MLKRHEKIWSPALGRDMWVLAYGHFGAPVIAFPSGLGNYRDFENFGMIEVLAPLIEGGRIKIYSPESNDKETWLSEWGTLGERAHRHRCYEDFVVNNLIPAIRHDCQSPQLRMAATGCSWGGYHAANFLLKFPELFHYSLCMSGRYDLGRSLDGEYSPDVYFNDPMAYMSNIHGDALERIRQQSHIALVCGQGEFEHNIAIETRRFGGILASKGISHECDVWGHDVAHKWYWWKKQIVYHFGKTFGG